MKFSNSYENSRRAEAYAKLEFPGTYYLAYRDLPEIIFEHAKGKEALDFGCGTGRSTRFLKRLGFTTVGVDIAEDMIDKAREFDPKGDYRLINDGDLNQFADGTYDIALSAFTFDNVPTREKKIRNFRELNRVLKDEGALINLVSSPEIYTHEWISFSTKDYPENKLAKSGEIVKIIQADTEDKRPVEDILWTAEFYQKVYVEAGLEPIKTYKPLAKENEPFKWVNETKIAPWTIYVLNRKRQKTHVETRHVP